MMKYFFQNAWFITGTQEIPGILAATAPGRVSVGFLSFVRLIGSLYFKKHLAVFILSTPSALYMSLTQNDVDHEQQDLGYECALCCNFCYRDTSVGMPTQKLIEIWYMHNRNYTD